MAGFPPQINLPLTLMVDWFSVKKPAFSLQPDNKHVHLIRFYYNRSSVDGLSHTRTVVRECCKDDDQSQWERPKFATPPPLNPLTDRHQNLPTWLRRGYLPSRKISSRSDKGVSFLRMRDFARQIVYSAICSFFLGGGVLQIVYSQDARTDFDAKYVKRRGSAQGCAFWGSQNQKLSFTPLFAAKTAILEPVFDGTIFARKRLLHWTCTK